MKKIIEIPAHKSIALPLEERRLRVAAYCRVSTNGPEQLKSLENQIYYYTNYITANPSWKFVCVYSDVGSGMNTKHRPGYRKMLRDAAHGKFDLLLVKSLSRFGRDTRETLYQIRRFQKMNVILYSDSEQISTEDVPESVLALWLAHVQEESHMKSENIKFGIRQRMKEGKAVLNHSQFLGYTKGTDGQLIIVPEEAEVVRKIFDLYLQGYGVRKIKRWLEEHHVKTVTGKDVWSTSTIDRMLSNEKYAGRLVLQKTFTPDFLTGKQEKNQGEISMIVVENAHEAIIDPEVFEKVQEKKGHSASKQ